MTTPPAARATFTARSTTQLPLLERFRGWEPRSGPATVAVIASSAAIAFASLFARTLTDAGLHPTTVAFARFAVIAVVLGRFVRLDRPLRSATLWGLASGASIAVGWSAYAHAIDTGALAGAGLVYMTYPLFTLVALATVFRLTPSRAQIAGGALVVVGALVAIGTGDGGVPLVAFLAPATFGFSIAVLTERLGVLDPVERLAAVAGGAAATLTPALLSLPRDEVIPGSIGVWAGVLALAVGCALVPMLVYAGAAPVIGGARTAVAGSIELPTMFAIGAVFFGESLELHHLLAGAIIATAIVVTPATRTVHVRPDADAALLDVDRPAERRG